MLTLKFDKDTGRMIGLDPYGYPMVAAVLKRRETVAVSITLYSAGVPAVFSGGTLSIGLKALGLYSGTLVSTVVLTLSGTTYTGDLSFSTTAIADLFAGVGLPPTEPAFVALAAEVIHSSGWTAEAVSLRCDNDYITGEEPAPGQSTSALTAALAERLIFRSALTGGTATSLDGVATTSLVLMTPCLVSQAGALSMWQLQTWDGVTAEDTANGLVLPDDANALTNLKIWVRLN
jgi:hypothetical protein